ncbi:MAG: aminopeptidase [Bacteroidales bacterium]|nr:aminopeptidase [Bacteroidales bacterium]
MYRTACLGLILAFFTIAGCGRPQNLAEPGVSIELSEYRSSNFSNIRYSLSFDLREGENVPTPAHETISLKLLRPTDIILDFRVSAENPISLTINGDNIQVSVVNEHIIIPKNLTSAGENLIDLEFIAGDQSLNRRSDFLYTLLVPDRARTLFPCFDQPDLKAHYSLTLSVPEEWTAVSNTYIEEEKSDGSGRKIIRFAETEPLSTYLFSFVAGRFERAFSERNGRTISMYYRETDPAKLAQQPDIFSLVFDALDYMEEYTGIPYPFAKYDFIVLPDFQYGGMEHTGATLYNDRRIFLGTAPTTAELLDRAQLIAHETAHMWFGDYVTMKWFNDVWTKEVFANWFAARIVRPAFPDVNHVLGDMKSYYAPAYAEDRTAGSNAIQRPLDNLGNAGLIYCNIIYDKAPVMMDFLARKMGPEALRRGLQRYLRQFGYGNASWDDLIGILESEADFDVEEWSRVWVKEKGMPLFESVVETDVVSFRQIDPFGAGNVWPQEISFDDCYGGHWLPDTDGTTYGCFLMDEPEAEFCYSRYHMLGETARMGVLMNLYENVWRKRIDAARFVTWAAEALYSENNSLIFGSMLGYAADAFRFSGGNLPILEQTLRLIASEQKRPHEIRLQAFRALYSMSTDPQTCDWLYRIWEQQSPPRSLSLGESDYTSLSYQLMLRFPSRAGQIRETQRSRISNPDRLSTFDFVVKAASPDREERTRFFNSLLQKENRRPESRVLSALDLLCHPIHGEESVPYIMPALEILPEIQRTGDIFFPSSWCKRILGPQTSPAAKEEVEAFLASHESMHPLLKTKILQAAGWLLQ